MNNREAITRAKLALPLPDLWRKLGWPGEPKKSCRRPFSPEDTRESASVFQKSSGEWCFHDFKAGETWDEIALLAQMEGLSNGDACRRSLALAGIKDAAQGPRSPLPAMPARSIPPPDVKPQSKPFLGTLRELGRDECAAIAASRGLLLDAAPYLLSDGREVKTLGVKGGWAAWPLGLPEMTARNYRRAVIVEGLRMPSPPSKC